MRKYLFGILSIFLAAVFVFALFACSNAPDDPETYTETGTGTAFTSNTEEEKDVSSLPPVQTVTDAATTETSYVSDIRTETETEPETETEDASVTETDAEPETEPETESETKPETVPETTAAYQSETEAVKAREINVILADITVTYSKYKDKAKDRLSALFDELRTADPDTADKWERIMDIWKKHDNDTDIDYDVLPDGLCGTGGLCIVVLGYQLNSDGSMKSELKERLKTALKCAEKYPNAYIVCTGGGTAYENRSATEAGVMAKWLIGNGISSDRVIVEDRSTSTAQNAVYTLEILSEKYPEISVLAIVTSDYHLLCGSLMFSAEAILKYETTGAEKYTVVAGAACAIPGKSLSQPYTPSMLIELAGDNETSSLIYHDKYEIPEL